MKAYFISGLGCDSRAFQRIELPPEYEIVHLDWLKPEEQEDIEHYSKRLAGPIDAAAPFILVGLSFGGMIAVEICKFKKPHKLFLISSVTSRQNMPVLYRICGFLRIDRLVPIKWLKTPKPILYWAFGPLDAETKPLFKEILFETDSVFLKWALGVILRWKNTQLPDQFIQIQGKRDRIFSCSPGKTVRLINAGGHFCVYSNSADVNQILKEELQVHGNPQNLIETAVGEPE